MIRRLLPFAGSMGCVAAVDSCAAMKIASGQSDFLDSVPPSISLAVLGYIWACWGYSFTTTVSWGKDQVLVSPLSGPTRSASRDELRIVKGRAIVLSRQVRMLGRGIDILSIDGRAFNVRSSRIRGLEEA